MSSPSSSTGPIPMNDEKVISAIQRAASGSRRWFWTFVLLSCAGFALAIMIGVRQYNTVVAFDEVKKDIDNTKVRSEELKNDLASNTSDLNQYTQQVAALEQKMKKLDQRLGVTIEKADNIIVPIAQGANHGKNNIDGVSVDAQIVMSLVDQTDHYVFLSWHRTPGGVMVVARTINAINVEKAMNISVNYIVYAKSP